ncbi:MAG: prepilin-type N-terminal cleavage/methylation domain-containing protein [Actinobacteria bacterium]|nr:prepilin-type N-terminal cleavage/methylation domain-containing protein [Actinomycetota bacterium]
MRATITRYIEALKKRRASDEGFSLIELIVVVAILGILVAIAIPVFTGLQAQALTNSTKAAAANAATQVASAIAATPQGTTPAPALPASTDEFTIAWGPTATGTAPTLVDEVCMTATSKSDTNVTADAGPGC